MTDHDFDSLADWFAAHPPTAVEVVRVSPEPGRGTFGRWQCWTGEFRMLDDDARAALVALVSQLPPAHVARCHEPGFGLRVEPGGVEITLCFECDNAYVGTELFSFAARSPAGAALLGYLCSLDLPAP